MVANFPFFRPGSIDLGPLELQPFGILVALGVVLGVYLMRRYGEAHGLEDDHVRGLVNWTVVLGFIGAHVFDVLAYQWHKLVEDPLLMLRIWEGISSYGGFIGGTLGFFIYARRHDLPIGRYADANMVALVTGFTLGRLGCTVVHDHIGAPSDGFFLATHYPQDAILRHGFGSPGGSMEPGLYHNLGFYEFLYMLALCGLLFGLSRWRGRPAGFMAVGAATAYAPVRFFLDFLRVNRDADPRYLGLTFAQWMSIILMAAGIYLVIYLLRKRAAGEVASGDAAAAAPAQAAKKGEGEDGKQPARKRRKKK